MVTYTKHWYQEGQRAFLDGQDVEDCPYDDNSEPYRAWSEGWYDKAEEFEDD